MDEQVIQNTLFDLQISTKLRGGYYTPSKLASWLCNWAIQKPTDKVLEPSSGDGAFLVEACKRLVKLGASKKNALSQIKGIEIVSEEAKKAKQKMKSFLGIHPNGQVACADFFAWNQSVSTKFDCVVGNPPFIRYQKFPEPSRSLAMALMEGRGLHPNKLTNIWVPFVVGGASRLREGGRLALVVPAELLQVTYASQLRQFLSDHFSRIHIYACNHLFFENAEQEVVLLLAEEYSSEAKNGTCLIELIEASKVEDVLTAEPNHKPPEEYSAVDHSTEKWLKYFLKPKEIEFMRSLKQHPEIAVLREHAEIDIGVVTGRNEFFVVNKETIQDFGLERFSVRLVGRSSQLKGAILTEKEWKSLADEGLLVYLLMLNNREIPLSESVLRYIKAGEKKDFDKGFKCSIRKPWYDVPSVWVPDCFFFRQIYEFPRVVINDAQATSTDTIHRMRCKSNREKVVTNLYTHLSAASAEIEGRSYGGGVLELEPTESEKLLVPKKLQSAIPLLEADKLIRDGKLSIVLEENDTVLRKIGLSKTDCKMLRQIWVRMRDRRRDRKR